MQYDKVLEGKFINMRSVTVDDAKFAYDIRNEFRETIGQVAASYEDQLKYIEKQIVTEGDYYFVITEKNGEPIGLNGVYDIKDGEGETGRFVCKGTPVQSIEAHLMLHDFAKNVLKLKKAHFVVYASNKKVVHLQKRMGQKFICWTERSGIESAYFEDPLDDTLPEIIKMRDLVEKM